MVRTLEVYRPPTAPRKAPSSTPAPSGGSKTAAFSPEDFVYQCWFLEVDCSAKAKQEFFSNGADNEYVKMPYLSASGDHGGNAGAMTFKQAVGANEALRTGTYSKSLTFTLSTTTP